MHKNNTDAEKKKTEEPIFSIDEEAEIQKTGVVAFSENFNSETSDFRQKDWKGNLCGLFVGGFHWMKQEVSVNLIQNLSKIQSFTICSVILYTEDVL